MVLPVVFRASIPTHTDVFLIGRWLIGYREKPIAPEWRELEFLRSAEGQRAWLESCFRMLKERSPEQARSFVLKYGQFQPSVPRWQTTRAVHDVICAANSPMSEEERAQLRTAIGTDAGWITIVSLSDFWNEWQLLEYLAEIAGKVAAKRNPITIKSDVERAKNLLDALWVSMVKLAERICPGHAASKISLEEQHEKERPDVRLADAVRENLRALLKRALQRAVGVPFTSIGFDVSSGFRLETAVHSVLGSAYLCVLANFSGNWKRCQRPDCRNLFLVSGRRTKYCDWYCGHLESVRRNRGKRRLH